MPKPTVIVVEVRATLVFMSITRFCRDFARTMIDVCPHHVPNAHNQNVVFDYEWVQIWREFLMDCVQRIEFGTVDVLGAIPMIAFSGGVICTIEMSN